MLKAGIATHGEQRVQLNVPVNPKDKRFKTVIPRVTPDGQVQLADNQDLTLGRAMPFLPPFND